MLALISVNKSTIASKNKKKNEILIKKDKQEQTNSFAMLC